MKRLLLFVLIIMGFCGRFASDAKRCPGGTGSCGTRRAFVGTSGAG